MIVVDASAMLEALLQTPVSQDIRRRLLAETLHAPHLLDVEVTQALRRYVHARDISAERGRVAVAELSEIPLRRYRHDVLLPRVWDLRDNLSAYDAVYVALAELLDAPLLTRDKRLAGATGHHARVELV